MEVMSQGAEARIYKSRFGSRECVVKERFKKTYRHPSLDERINKKRTVLEARCLLKALRAGIHTPVLFLVDPVRSLLYMEYVHGQSVKSYLKDGNQCTNEERKVVAENIGKQLAKLHNVQVIHGDLTTSNMMLRQETNEVVLIDFGLSFVSSLLEDKAVDLYVLERALSSTHPDAAELLELILAEYFQNAQDSKSIAKRLEDVRLRGRKRDMAG